MQVIKCLYLCRVSSEMDLFDALASSSQVGCLDVAEIVVKLHTCVCDSGYGIQKYKITRHIVICK